MDIIKRLTVEDVQKAFPSRQGTITEELVEMINSASNEAEFQGESLMQTMVMYEKLMLNNKASVKEFVDAVRFCAYLVTMEDNYTEAFKRVFYYRDFVKNRLDAEPGSIKYNELSSAASRYRRQNKLVNDLLLYSQAPMEIMFLGGRYKALSVLQDTMVNAKLDRDKINAAKEFLAATKGPENMKIELDVGVKENSAVTSMMDQLRVLSAKQKEQLEAGVNTLTDFGGLKPKEEIIDGEYE